MGSCVYRKNLL